MSEISFPASEIPEWFDLRGDGSSLSFNLPSFLRSDGYQLQGLLVWVLHTATFEGSFALCKTILRNKNNGEIMFEN